MVLLVNVVALCLTIWGSQTSPAHSKAPACGGTLTAKTGTIMTPNFPNNYPNEVLCTWTIQGPPGTRQIELEFNQFVVEWGGVCEWDYMMIKDKDGNIIRNKMCSNQYTPFPVVIPGDTAVVIFESDDQVTEKGFKATYKAAGPPPKKLAGSCDFDQGICPGLSNVANTDDFDWTLNSGPTPTGYLLTGPKADHTSGKGKYVYIESTGRQKGDKAQLETQSMSGNRCMTFFYHMYGTIGMGSLKVYVVTKTGRNLVSTLNGNQGNEWKQEKIQITESTPYKVVFEAAVGRYDDSDIALDDILFSDSTCGKKECHETFTAPSGSFTSPGYPNDYKDNLRCKWTIKPSKKGTILIEFKDFDTRTNFYPCKEDYVTVSDSKGKLVRPRFCGVYPYGFGVKVQDTEAVVQFITDTGFAEKGFKAEYKVLPASSEGCDFEKGVCNGWSNAVTADINWLIGEGRTPSRFTGPESAVYRLGKYAYVESSGQNPNARAVLLSPRISGKHCLTFYYNMNGQKMGSLIVYTQAQKGRTLVWRAVGHHGRYWQKESIEIDAGQSYSVSFEGNVGNGFTSDMALDEISLRPGSCPVTACDNKILTAASGLIKSPNYPSPYPSGVDCKWTIIPPPQYKNVNIVFNDIEMQDSATCSKDYIIVRDTSGPIGTQIGEKLCGKPKLPQTVAVNWNQAKVRFHSDGSVEGKGFQARYQAVGSVPACGGQITTDSGTLQSPGYPNNSPERLTCEWEIRASAKTKEIVFTFEPNFAIDDTPNICHSDYVLIAYGHTEKKQCGKYAPWPVRAQGNVVSVQFRTDYITGKDRKFKVRFAAVY